MQKFNAKIIMQIVGLLLLLWCQIGFSYCSKANCVKPPPLPDRAGWIISGTYVSAFGGYASEDWVTFADTPFVSYSSNPRGGMNYGFTVGYRFYRFFAVEGGWVRLPTVKGIAYTTASASATTLGALASVGISQWLGYLAGKFYLTLVDHFYLFGGAGIMYRSTNPHPSQLFTNSEAYYYAPIALAGLEWYFDQDWAVYTQYFFIPQYNQELPPQPIKFFNVPAANLIELGLIYKFSI